MTQVNALKQLVLEAEGGPVNLASYWQRQPLVVVLLRHLGCPVCREQLHLSADMAAEIRSAGADLLAVVHGSGQQAAALAREQAVDFPVLGDPEQDLYRLLGMKRGSLYEVTLRPILRQPLIGLRRLFRARRPGPDIRQLGGAAIIDSAGVLRWCYRAEDSGDIPTNKQVLDALNAVTSRNH